MRSGIVQLHVIELTDVDRKYNRSAIPREDRIWDAVEPPASMV